MGPDSQSKDPLLAGIIDRGHHHANPVISKRIKWTSQENKIVMERYLLSESKI